MLDKLLNKYDNVIKELFSKYGSDVATAIIDKWLPEFGIISGDLQSNIINASKQALLYALVQKIKEKYIDILESQIIKAIDEISPEISDSYGKLTTEQAVKKSLFEQLGIDSKGMVKGGYLSNLIGSDTLLSEIQKTLYSDILSGKGYRSIVDNINKMAVSGGENSTLFERYQRTYSNDLFTKVNQNVSNKIAKENKLEYFLYVGGLVDTSRQYCEKRNSVAYSIYEAEYWYLDEDLIDPSTRKEYDWQTDVGRYNCRHYYRYITENEAIKRRPELIEFKNKTIEDKKAIGKRLFENYRKSK